MESQLQHQSFQRNPRTNLLQNGLVGSPCSPRDSQGSSPTPQFKSIILRCSTFLTVQLLHPYMTTGKTIALTRPRDNIYPFSPPWPLCYCHTFYFCKCYKPFNTLLLFLLSKLNYFKELFNNKDFFLYLYLPFLLPFVPLISISYHSSPCRNSFNISGCGGLLVMNSFSFYMPGKAIFELSEKAIF